MTPSAARQALVAGNRRALAQCLSRAESTLDADHLWLDELWQGAPPPEPSRRFAITGSPGAGKSTLIEALGTRMTGSGQRVAVLTIDPSSHISGGSLLADKTRMPQLSTNASAYVRPSASRSQLGGVAAHIEESVRLCELAGYDTTLIETVGVGQSEIEAADLSDLSALLVLPHGGDEVQALKRGIMEVVDIVVVNKADGEWVSAAQQWASKYVSSLALLRPQNPAQVLTTSALSGAGIAELWSTLDAEWQQQRQSGVLNQRRAEKRVRQFQRVIERGLLRSLLSRARNIQLQTSLESELAGDRINLRQACSQFINGVLKNR